MKYKLLIVKNNFNKKYDFKKGLDWFKQNTPLEIEVSELTTNIPLTFEKLSNDTYEGWTIDEKVKEELRKLVPRNTYQCVVLLYGDKAPGIRVSVADQNPLYPETEFIEVVKLEDKGLTVNHEILHTFFHKLKRQGVFIDDPMDRVVVNGVIKYYFNNNNLNAKLSNRTIALERLSPHWDKIGLRTALNGPNLPVNDRLPYEPIYFTPKEVLGLKNDFVRVLDTARAIAKVPFIITSGYRTPEHNKAVGGVSNSSHVKGLAVDLAVKDNMTRTRILRGLLTCGTDLFIEDCRKHIHVDMDNSIHSMGDTIWANDD